MRILNFDKKSGDTTIIAENIDDLWHLAKIISDGDLVSAETVRTVRVGTTEEKKPVYLTIAVEEVEFSHAINRLRVRGKIVAGRPEEFIQLGRYHTIDIEPNTKLTITKEWKEWQIARLKEAEKETKRPKIRIIVLDDEKALTAVVRGYGVEYGVEIYNAARKGAEKYEEKTLQYFGEITAEIEKHPERYVIAGPGFTKENLREFIKKRNPGLLKRISFENCSYAERSGVNELFKCGVIEKIMGEERLEREMKLFDEFLTELRKESGLAVYGIKEVKAAVEASAIKKLLILDELLRTSKEAEETIEMAESKAEIVIFSSESDAGIRLKGFGGIAALLKFKLE
jgi:protein pelota